MSLSPASPRKFSLRHGLLSCLLGGQALLAIGCGSQPTAAPTQAVSAAKATADREDELHNGLRYVRLVHEYEYDKASEKALGSLNSWLSSSHDDRDYKIDPLRDRLPKELKPFFPTDGLAAEKFRSDDYSFLRQYLPVPPIQTPIANGVRSSDFRYLHETYLLRRISDWAVKQPGDPETEAWVAEKAKSLDEKSARKLRDVSRLFDWTVRHLQLEPTPPEPARAAAGPTGTDASGRPVFPPALAGQHGPGYAQFPGHCLLIGRGDFVQRAWIFCLLARQVECDVLMLAFENKENSRPEPWLPGAIIGDQVYLFDTRLGLPVPLEGDKGIATLAQVRENDTLLRRLDLSAEMVYPANKDNLQRLVGLVEFCDASISKRMSLLESRLTGEEQMVLAVHPSEIASAAQKAGVSQVYPWRIAYDAILFRAYIDMSLRTNPAFYAQYYSVEAPFMRPSELVTARHMHLVGDFAGNGEVGGALDAYMASRVATKEISQFEQTEEGRRLLETKLFGERELTEADKAQMIAARKNFLSLAKMHASFYMGQAQYDRGAFPLAQEWFQKRSLEVTPDGPWAPGAKYGAARALEMQHKYREARDIYLADQSPQKEGSLLRARKLKPLADAQPATPSTTEGKPSTPTASDSGAAKP